MSEQIKNDYNKLGFISALMIDTIDKLEGTNVYRQALKNLLKRVLKELEDIVKKHFMAYDSFGNIDNEGKAMHSMNIYNITADKYDEVFEMLKNDNPAVICSKMQYLKEMDDNKFDWSKVIIPAKDIRL